jgi:HSP20 family protein
MFKKDKQQGSDGKTGGLGEMFKGLSDLIERLGDLAEHGEELNHSSTSEGKSPSGKPLRAVYGFSVKFGGGNEGMKVEPFGHTRAAAPRATQKDNRSAEKAAPVHEVREPMVDLFEEKDGVHLVAEMPGVAAADVRLEIQEDILVLKAESGDKKYWKELVLPRPYRREDAAITCNNGMVEIWLK